ncbi:MAG: LPS export ABC transporter permease LptG [Sphingomonadaceae bacterium]
MAGGLIPSRPIALYMAKLFFTRSLAVLLGLVLILMTLDLLGESGKILAQPGSGNEELVRYVSLRLPQLVERFLPFSILLGTIIALASLNQHSEVIAMKAAGISAHQILAPLIAASLLVAGASFAFNEAVVADATAELAAWEAEDYGPVPPDDGVERHVWVREGANLIHAERVVGEGRDTRLHDVAVYDRGGGRLRSILSARIGYPREDGWLLQDVVRFDVETGAEQRFEGVITAAGVSPDQFTLSEVEPEETDFFTLRRAIAELKRGGQPTGPLEAGLWHKISGPLSTLLMPLLAGVAAFGLARSGQLALRAIIAMALGFAYFVVDNFALAMGDFGAYPPLLAAWAPFFLFLLVGETVLVRSEE